MQEGGKGRRLTVAALYEPEVAAPMLTAVIDRRYSRGMILRARVVVTMDGPPIDNGGVAISGNRIVDVGTFAEISARNSGTVVELDGQALLPGFINTHCHLDYTCLRGKIPSQKSFTDWIRAINAEKAKLLPDDYVASIKEGFAEAKRFGTTTIANLTGFPELVSQLEAPIRTWWFAELIDLRNPSRPNMILDLSVEQLRSALESADRSALSKRRRAAAVQNWGLAPHAPFTASPTLFRCCEEIAQRDNILLTTHLAESREEMSMFRDARGPLYDFLNEIGRDMRDCGGKTPIARFFEFFGRSDSPARSATALQARPDRPQSPIRLRSIESPVLSEVERINRPYLLAHLNELADKDFELLRKSATKVSAVHCPRSHNYFGHTRFQFEKLKSLGLNICLGTDSLASNADLSLFSELRAFRNRFSNVPAGEILALVTTNGARALRQENVLGKIAVGFFADLIAIPCSGSKTIFEEIIGFNRDVNWSMVDGVGPAE